MVAAKPSFKTTVDKEALVPKAKEKKIARWYDYMMGGVIFENDCSYQQHYNEDHSK